MCRIAKGLIALVAVLLLEVLSAADIPAPDSPMRPLGGSGPAVAGVAARPPLGWNSWNTFGCLVTQDDVRAQADAMVSSGMRAAGYSYVVVDDCWFAPQRDVDGQLRADPARFPAGMAALADYVHAQGLKFGIYASPADRTCAQLSGNYPGATGSAGHERTDAATFAAWGVDYLKYDWCSEDPELRHQIRAFTAMRDALRATGRPIVYSINPNSGVAGDPPGRRFDWAGIATMARTTQDVDWAWALDPAGSLAPNIGVTQAVNITAPLISRTEGRYFNDPDMLVVGIPGAPGSLTPGLSQAEARTQVGMWAMMSAPLIAGNDLQIMPPWVRAMLVNPTVLAVDQDIAGGPATPLRGEPGVWRRHSSDGALVVACRNEGNRDRRWALSPAQLGLPAGRYTVTDLWTGATEPLAGQLVRTVGGHDTALLGIVPTP
jgi:alpha-galactosidase